MKYIYGSLILLFILSICGYSISVAIASYHGLSYFIHPLLAILVFVALWLLDLSIVLTFFAICGVYYIWEWSLLWSIVFAVPSIGLLILMLSGFSAASIFKLIKQYTKPPKNL